MSLQPGAPRVPQPPWERGGVGGLQLELWKVKPGWAAGTPRPASPVRGQRAVALSQGFSPESPRGWRVRSMGCSGPFHPNFTILCLPLGLPSWAQAGRVALTSRK